MLISWRSKIAQLPRPAAQQSTLQTATARTGNIVLRASGTGTLTAAVESSLGFKTSGTLTVLNVQVGSQVKAGDLIAQLDSSNQQLALAQAQQALNQLTSPSAIANAQQALVTAQTNLTNAQYVLNGDLAAGSNQSAINNAQAALALAQTKLTENQNNYQNDVVGSFDQSGCRPGIPGSVRCPASL